MLRLPYRYFRRLRGYLIAKEKMRLEAMKPKDDDDIDWDADRVDGGPT